MSDTCENAGPLVVGGAVAGALTGMSLLIYYGVTLIQPEFEKIKGINDKGADGITAAICIAGMAAACAGGMIAGACAGGITTCFYEAAKGCGRGFSSFFKSHNSSNNSRGSSSNTEITTSYLAANKV